MNLDRIVAGCRHIQNWMANFAPKDRALARDALLSLEFVTTNELHSNLLTKLERLRDSIEKVAFYAVREVEELEYLTNKTEKPDPVARGAGRQGSEFAVAELISRVCDGRAGKYDHTSLVWLKRAKVSDIVFVDDFSGSGSRIKDFLSAWRQIDTIKSYLSSGWIRFHVVVYGITATAEEQLRSLVRSEWGRSSYEKQLIIHGKVVDDCLSRGNASFTDECISLFTRYSSKSRAVPNPLGYGGVGANIVFEHSCPNNVPTVFWGSKDDWHPLFPGRRISGPILTEMKSLHSTDDGAEHRSTDLIEVTIFKFLISGMSDPLQIGKKVDLPRAKVVKKLRDWCEQGFLTNGWQLTKFGRKYAMARVGGTFGWKKSSWTVKEYFPTNFGGD